MATFCTRIYVKVDNNELMDKLITVEIGDLGRGYYSAEAIFEKGATESYFCDTESALNESDIQELVTRVGTIIKDHGVILADTFSYDYDPMPFVCFYNGNETTCKMLDMDGEEFQQTIDIRDSSEWINYVDAAEDIRGEY